MKGKSLVVGAGLLSVIVTVSVLRASAAPTAPLSEVTQSMQQAKIAAFQLSKTADRLHAITRSGDHSWQSHSWYLDFARDDVNQLGKMLSDLENVQHQATRTQQIGIERLRPQLVKTANALTTAINLLNEHRHNAYFPEYRQAVEKVSEQATSLHQNLDAVLDYEALRARLQQLELLPSNDSGS